MSAWACLALAFCCSTLWVAKGLKKLNQNLVSLCCFCWDPWAAVKELIKLMFQFWLEFGRAFQVRSWPENKCVVIESTVVMHIIPKSFTVSEMLIVFCLLCNLLVYQKLCNYLCILKVQQWEWMSVFAVQLLFSNGKACWGASQQKHSWETASKEHVEAEDKSFKCLLCSERRMGGSSYKLCTEIRV